MTSVAEFDREMRVRRALHAKRRFAGEGMQHVGSAISDSFAVLPTSSIQLIDDCRGFQTVAEHAKRICEQRYSPVHLKAIEQQLIEFARSGFLVSENQLKQTFKTEDSETEPGCITAIAIPTKDRPERLLIGLESYAGYRQKFARDLTFLVADQSQSETVRNQNIETIGEIKKKYGGKYFHGSVSEVETMAADLARESGVSPDIVRFALLNDLNFPKAYGANRNALLLATIDELIMQTDDDGDAKTKAVPQQEMERLVLTSNFSEYRPFFPSEQELTDLFSGFETTDVLRSHETLLGKSVSSCMNDFRAVSVDRAENSFFSRSHGRVVAATMFGSVGTSGIGTSFWTLFADDRARASLMRSESNYRFAMDNHYYVRNCPYHAISSGTMCGGLNLGLDNRQLLPPFLPVQRNEDIVFGQLMQLGTVGYIGYVPVMTLHLGPNTGESDFSDFASNMLLGSIIERLVSEIKMPSRELTVTERFRTIGKALVDLTGGTLAEFENELRMSLMTRTTSLIARLQDNLKTFGNRPEYWATDAERCIDLMQRAMVRPDYIVPSDIKQHFGDDATRELVPATIRRYGQLLIAWPNIRNAARALKHRGWQPFREI